ncbi:DUF1648 domain-containing protein [uncultured Aquimarina sp.]|uniref:DUF1648 domain-containing protein n=1 Tax=uncultured Aquimarina sp. TaxID=575652 RepID=UPI00263661F9|nr:DUF1648 domain-containing protein [uncultured Aquimarina sp.]
MSNPIIRVNKEAIDIVLEILTFVGLGILILAPIFYINELPEMIPTHFNAQGLPDDYSSKSTIWFLPVVGLVMGIGLYILNRFPHIFNYPAEITEDNAFRQYKNATRLIRVLNLTITWTFVFIIYKSIAVALNRSEGLGAWFIPVFIGVMIGPIAYFTLKSFKA